MLWCVIQRHVWKYFQFGAIDADSIRPPSYFTWYWSGGVRPFPGPGMSLFFDTMGLLGLGVLLGLHDRVCVFLCRIVLRFRFLPDQADHLVHDSRTCLLVLLTAFVPAHPVFSPDAWMRPQLRSPMATR